jgi:transcriptional regulator with XRE-family HTH domain
METLLLAPKRGRMSRSAGQARQRRRANGPRKVRYRFPVRKEDPTFGQVLAESIELWYESDSDFARKANVSSSAVSRWVAGAQVPRPETIEKMAPWVKDSSGRAYPAARLLAIAYPGFAAAASGRTAATTQAPLPVHPLARDVVRMLAPDSPLPAAKREALESLLDALVAPYRTYLGKRKSG